MGVAPARTQQVLGGPLGEVSPNGGTVSGKALDDDRPPASTEGMVSIPKASVVLGPRHIPPVSPAYAPKIGRGAMSAALPEEPTSVEGANTPWVSMGGRALPQRTVVVESFWIDRTEVTRADYSEFLQATGYRLPHVSETWAEDGWNWRSADDAGETAQHPIVLTNFYDAREYCRWKKKRLPTEAEWHLAALGPHTDGRVYPWGTRYQDDVLNHGRLEQPNFDGSDGFERTSPVGAFPAGNSPYGLADMFGNAWEFTSDFRMDDWRWYKHDGYGEKGALLNVRMPGPGLRVAVRGGSFYFDFRPHPGGEWNAFSPEVRRKSTGFRCALSRSE